MDPCGIGNFKMALLICLIFSARAARGKIKKYDTTSRVYIFKGAFCTIAARAN
jgi:hypothetical protein